MRSNKEVMRAKRIISACAAAFTLLCNAAPAGAHEISESTCANGIESTSNSSMGEYIDLAMSNYIIAAGLDADANYTVTNAIPVFAEGDQTPLGYTVFLIGEDGTVGEMGVYQNNGSYTSVFSLNPDLDKHCIMQGNISIIVNEGGKWLCNENNEVVSLAENADDDFAPTSFDNGTAVMLNYFTINSECLISPMGDTGTTLGRVSLNVSYVENYTGYDVNNGNGICWAATIAMKVNYLKGKSLDAKAVYDLAEEKLNSTEGTISTVKGVYKEYGINVTSKTTSSGFITNQQAWDLLNDNDPIDLAIIGYLNSNYTGEEHYHQVLLTGMTIGTTGLSYEFYCPNNENKKYVFISGTPTATTSKKMGDFMYTDDWSRGKSKRFWKEIYRLYY